MSKRWWQFLSIVGYFLCLIAFQTVPQAIELAERAVGLRAAKWNINQIPVCWENMTQADSNQRQWVRAAVVRTWETHSALRFVGWNQCQGNSSGIRILIQDAGPHVKALGQLLNGMVNGMVLNFGFNNWSPSCRQRLQFCIEVIAVHEFGHAIGFAHEQNRTDAPLECQRERQGTDGDTFLTPYDANSVMNYCNPNWNGDGQLSPMDIRGVQAWYPPVGRPIPPSPQKVANGAFSATTGPSGKSNFDFDVSFNYPSYSPREDDVEIRNIGGSSFALLPINGASIAYVNQSTYQACIAEPPHKFNTLPHSVGMNSTLCIRTREGNISAIQITRAVATPPQVIDFSYNTWKLQ